MKTFRLFSMAALALMMAACSSEDNTLETASPAAPGKLQFTATIATPDNGAGTRTEYSEQPDGTIKVAWKVNDEIAAIVTNSEGKYVKDVLTVSKVNADGSATISGDITKPKDDAPMVDLIYPEDIVTVAADGSVYSISFEKMRDGSTLDGTPEKIAANIDYRLADDCPLTVSGDKATLTSAAKLVSKLSIWKLTLQDKGGNDLSASKVTIKDGDGVTMVSSAASGSTVYLPVPAASDADICIAATTSGGNYIYMKEDVTLATGKYYQSTVQMTKGAHLALLTADYEAKDGETLTGTLASNVKISIAAPVAPATTTTVTLKDVTINGNNNSSYDWAGITCEGSATIILEGTNTVKGFYEDYPGIYVPENKTLTIDGTGSLTASSNDYGAGIGGGNAINCGNIEIKGGEITAGGGSSYSGSAGIGGGSNASCGNITISGGTITANSSGNGAGIGGGGNGICGTITINGGTVTASGDYYGAGIGCGYASNGLDTRCGDILINGGTVTATGGENAAGIGGGFGDGFDTTCGTITINNKVTKLTATKGSGAGNSIGPAGVDWDVEYCGTVTIGGTEYWDGTDYKNEGDTYLETSPLVYPAP